MQGLESPWVLPGSAGTELDPDGLETLSLRMERHVSNAKTLAAWLEKQPQVEKVNYASLPSSPWHKLATKYAPTGSGSVLPFEIKGGIEAGKKFVEALKLH